MLPRDCRLPWILLPSDLHPPGLQSHRRILAPGLTERFTFAKRDLFIDIFLSIVIYLSVPWTALLLIGRDSENAFVCSTGRGGRDRKKWPMCNLPEKLELFFGVGEKSSLSSSRTSINPLAVIKCKKFTRVRSAYQEMQFPLDNRT